MCMMSSFVVASRTTVIDPIRGCDCARRPACLGRSCTTVSRSVSSSCGAGEEESEAGGADATSCSRCSTKGGTGEGGNTTTKEGITPSVSAVVDTASSIGRVVMELKSLVP